MDVPTKQKPARKNYGISPSGAALLRATQQMKIAKEGSKYSLDALAAECGLKKPTLSAILNGHQGTMHELPKLCRLLGVPIYRVLNGVDDDAAALLSAYDKLSPDDRNLVMEMCRSLAPKQNSAPHPSPPSNHLKARRP